MLRRACVPASCDCKVASSQLCSVAADISGKRHQVVERTPRLFMVPSAGKPSRLRMVRVSLDAPVPLARARPRLLPGSAWVAAFSTPRLVRVPGSAAGWLVGTGSRSSAPPPSQGRPPHKRACNVRAPETIRRNV